MTEIKIEITHEPGERTISIGSDHPLHCKFRYSSNPKHHSVIDHDGKRYTLETWADCVSEYDMWLESQLLAGNTAIISEMEKIAALAMEPEGVKLLCPFHLTKESPNQIIIRYVKDAINGTGIFAN